jgi:hypothetical protein
MKPLAPKLKAASSRIIALDYLRGFFIIVIICDHLWRWPNIFEFASGRGELWSSAAEGFVMISGLLVGYIRGYKDQNKSIAEVSKKVIKRGVLLYVWMIITTLLLVAASWAFDFEGSMAYIPIEENHWHALIVSVLRFDYVHTLTHFLYLYAIFLVLSPILIMLMRRNLSWIGAIASLSLWLIGVHDSIEWMQWQILFFLPAIGGFYLETFLAWFRRQNRIVWLTVRYGLVALTALTAVLAGLEVLPHEPGTYESSLFGREPITLGTIAISFLWFGGLLSLFQFALPWLRRWLGWLLLTFGERSLTAYILHTVPLVLCSLLFVETTNFWENSLLAAGCVIFTWMLLKIPHVNKVIPR